MNFIFISPQFPHTYWQFCDRLKQNGVNVLGVADVPYDSLAPELKCVLTEYYRVDNLEDYDQVFRTVAFLSYKYGKIDWIESNNEYWLEQDARLRTDFNVTTGIQSDSIASIKEKSEMKKYYAKGGIPTARQMRASKGAGAVIDFAIKTGFPIIAKPDIGVGAGGTHKLHNEAEIHDFFHLMGTDAANYVVEEFVTGDICSYDAIIDSKGRPLFESMTVWPPSIMDIVNKRLDLAYYVSPVLPDQLRVLGRRTIESFGVKSRFVHLEFFRLDRERQGLGHEGDFVALEVNMRPAGGYTPDMINYAHSTDVYKIWADMIAQDQSRLAEELRHDSGNALSIPWREEFYCVFASRRDIYQYYEHSHEEILERYSLALVQCERMPDIFHAAMGQQMYTVKVKTEEEKDEFIQFVHAKK